MSNAHCKTEGFNIAFKNVHRCIIIILKTIDQEIHSTYVWELVTFKKCLFILFYFLKVITSNHVFKMTQTNQFNISKNKSNSHQRAHLKDDKKTKVTCAVLREALTRAGYEGWSLCGFQICDKCPCKMTVMCGMYFPICFC
jgi:hypothetical protein